MYNVLETATIYVKAPKGFMAEWKRANDLIREASAIFSRCSKIELIAKEEKTDEDSERLCLKIKGREDAMRSVELIKLYMKEAAHTASWEFPKSFDMEMTKEPTEKTDGSSD